MRDTGIVGPGARALGRLDARSFAAAAIGALCFWLLAVASLSLLRFDSTLAAVWLPNACAVAFLLRARLANELPFLAAILAASTIGNTMGGTAVEVAAVFSFANVIDIAVVTWLTRRSCGLRPDMTRIEHLARVVWAGGLVGPVLSASLAAFAMGPDSAAIRDGVVSWLLTDSMGMVLIVPTVLLVFDALRNRVRSRGAELAERTALLITGSVFVFMVFRQTGYPLLFLIPPITLLHAFRLGSLGTALFVALVALISTTMTWAGYGPIALASTSDETRLHLIQAFVAANFLTGLPVAAVLAGRNRIMEELDSGRRELALLTENATDALMCFDLAGVCTYASPSVATVLAEPIDTFLGQRPSDRAHADAHDRIVQAQQRLIDGESENERFTYRRLHDSAAGTPVFLEAECAIALDPDSGEREGIVVSIRDVTERVELELQLTGARRHAENAARAKSEFLANMSHEIRTPMNGVLGFAELMLQGDLDADQRRHIQMIVESGRSMMLLLNDILDLSKIEAGQIAIHHAPVDLAATIEECAALHRQAAEKKGLKLHVARELRRDGSVADELPWVSTDGLRLRQMVLNLVGNAVKFTEKGQIHIGYAVTDQEITVRVADTGIGITAARLESIFQPFTQGESDTARRYGGTGLGLSISRQLAELLGGFIDVESQPGVGSCFTLTLPATQASPDCAAEAEPSAPLLGPEMFPQSARILLAEDHDVNRELMVEMLERCGLSIEIAQDGNEAISLVIDGLMRDRPYDLVLMDIQMPGCDGYEATRAIRAEGIGPGTLPIIALTANAFPQDIAEARTAGMQAHLAKPIDFADLAKALQRWLPTRIIDLDGAPDVADCDSGGQDETPNPAKSRRPTEMRSPELTRRWQERREAAIEAVRAALASGMLGSAAASATQRDELAATVHKLAGTAAMFGEPELGDQAAALERALRLDLGGDVREMLAGELLDRADDSDGGTERLGEASG
ncbi:ATP-binding protein [Erythrobacter sp. JK5]|uniref:ATP-binding protein n=1 Tax=Erythrobacter sp. JK5 TaxID=2829500 RepID=UPI001BA620DE|nr:ATP-binding protein [Erythrobacter sp. JK5]QUL36839.1 MASE1 domain-containing protein [Erythrobacter sp. JK5]